MITIIAALVILNIALLIYAIGVKMECNDLINEILEIYNCINNDN
jgi:uncharacterized membrane protein